MLRIIEFKVRQNRDGDLFLALIVQGGISLVKSKETGLYYATAQKASIPSTFDEETCKSLISQELDGTVERVECEPFQIVSEETGEVIELSHRWVFLKPGDTVENVVEQYQEEPELV